MANPDWSEKRLHPRVSWNFVVKYRSHQDKDTASWEVAVIQNISKGGCYFFSGISHKIGEILDIEIQFPNLLAPMKFSAQVNRCIHSSDPNLPRYGIGVYFTEMDESKRNSFEQTLDFFLKKKPKAGQS
ncbi:MAG: PilZ domain-containing protein [Candidatus Omnitrophica bacterium]|nr:PilZ domain-containing protein [Candidatus Omnitrophota bacterium]MDD5238333.1 PilZ domain-containing protein [Candidatus Omnitrophota bacterium]